MAKAKTTPPAAKRSRVRPEEDEDDTLEGDDFDEEGDEKPSKKVELAPKFRESAKSVKAKKDRREPAESQDKRQKVKVTLIATRLGFDGTRRIRPGAEFQMKVPVEEDGTITLPTWASLPEDYVPEPELELPPGMKATKKVQGGAFRGGLGGGRMEL